LKKQLEFAQKKVQAQEEITQKLVNDHEKAEKEKSKMEKVSISSTFYMLLFHMKVLCAAFL